MKVIVSSFHCALSRSLPAQHPCALQCHAPSACNETEPCHAIITITCPCGRIKQPIACGRSTSNPAGRESTQVLKCTSDCAIAKRNAKLAEALGIDPDAKSGGAKTQSVVYVDELVTFGKANAKFVTLVEKTLAE